MNKSQSLKHGQADCPFPIRTESQLEALISPVRQEIVDALAAAGACTVAELGQHLQRAPDSLYPHLDRLMAAGLVVERAPRKDGRHVAAVIDLPGRPLRVDYRKLGRSPLLPKVIERALKLCLRDFRRTLTHRQPDSTNHQQAARGGRVKGWLSPSEHQAVQHHLDCIHDLLNSGRPGEGREPYALGFILSPASGTRRKP